ncbi:hypothetical protein [Phaeacidiphilus oryzae]|uniref:hypothetical protein n=1 Tax=Phaeacidiphilus oryzae TaxID=348818 RepID=UPI000A918A95|nr:hypothetical protein [Phaeacidiphilus oryzae]
MRHTNPADPRATGRLAGSPIRRHIALLSVWAAVWFAIAERHGGVSWHYLRSGQQLLFGAPGGGLALYANHPELQIGPVSFLAAGIFSPFRPGLGETLAEAVMSGLGLAMLIVVGRTAAHYYRGTGTNHHRLQQRILIAGAAFVPMWVEVSVRFAHLDDVLALFFTTLAVRRLVSGHAAGTAVFLALAVDSKPWALPFLALLLALPREQRLRSAVLTVTLIGAAWLPFYLGDIHSFAAARYAIPNQPASSLRWLGVHDPGTPSWDRPAQVLLGFLLGALAVRRGHWPAVVLVSANARIALDPSVYTYYSASVLLGTLLWDAIGQRRLVPWYSWVALLILYGTSLALPHSPVQGLIRLAFATLSTLAVLLTRRPKPGRSAEGTGPRAERGAEGAGQGRGELRAQPTTAPHPATAPPPHPW